MSAISTPAVALCSDCGAGLCFVHMVERPPNHVVVETVGPVGRRVETGSPVRKLLCPPCHHARHSGNTALAGANFTVTASTH